MAMVKTLQFLATENQGIFVASVYLGMVDTGIFRKSGAKLEMLPMDTATLSAHFMLWLSSPEGAFLRGKFVWANWDVEDLKAIAAKIQEGPQMTVGVAERPFERMI